MVSQPVLLEFRRPPDGYRTLYYHGKHRLGATGSVARDRCKELTDFGILVRIGVTDLNRFSTHIFRPGVVRREPPADNMRGTIDFRLHSVLGHH